jgi:hypothetical protein
MGTADSKAKWHIKAKDTLYNYYPKLDNDMVDTNRHLVESENRLGTSFVQTQDDNIGSSIGITQYPLPLPHDPLAPKKINYYVPNFGPDPEVAGTMESIATAEKQVGETLIMGTDDSKAKWHKVAKDTLYDYHPALEDNIKTTWRNLEAAEDKLGITFEDANLIQSDPITDSTGEYTQYTHPESGKKKWKMNYEVPNFGPDGEIENVKSSITGAETSLGIKWNPIEVDPAKIINYPQGKFGLESDMQSSLKSLRDTQS